VANLISHINADDSRTQVHRIGHRSITADVRTWTHAVAVTMDKHGDYTVTVRNLDTGSSETLAAGNVETQVGV
jgi:hypothetical protein